MGAPSEGTARLEEDEKEQAFKPTPELQGGGGPRRQRAWRPSSESRAVRLSREGAGRHRSPAAEALAGVWGARRAQHLVLPELSEW